MDNAARYPVPANPHRVDNEIQRSRFITDLAPAPDVAAAKAFIDTIRAEFPDATHHCWAYLVGPPGSSAQVGMSDDGEPHGTAGRPMLHVLSHAEVGDVVAVVTRYYGGTKLGKGGLARAYSGGVQDALNQLPTREKVTYCQARVAADYTWVQDLERLFERLAVQVNHVDYAAAVRFELAVPEDRTQSFAEQLEQITHGALSVDWED